MIPVSARGGKTRMSVAGQFVVFLLDDEFRTRKRVVIPGVVYVEMRADEGIDVLGTQVER